MARPKSVKVSKPKPIKLTLDKKRNFVLDMNTYVDLEDLYDGEKRIDEILDDFFAGYAKAIRNLLWAGLYQEDDELTPEEVGKLIAGGDAGNISHEIMESIYNSMPEKEEGTESKN